MSAEGDPRLLNADDLAAMQEHWFSVGKQDPGSRGTQLTERGDFRVLLFGHVEAQAEQIARLTAALEVVVKRYPRGCTTRYSGRDAHWTCLDQQQWVRENPDCCDGDYAEKYLSGDSLCDICLLRAALAARGGDAGEVVMSSQVKCRDCDGKGEIHDLHHSYRCTTCKGTGNVQVSIP